MKALYAGLIVLMVLILGIFLYRDYYVKRKFRKLSEQKFKVFEPLIKKLSSKENVTIDEIPALAKSPSTRYGLFTILKAFDRKDLFPDEYLTLEKGAESHMVSWLEFPTELGVSPAEIELLTKISVNEDQALTYFVFQYKTSIPHWAASIKWMLGVAGPYHKESNPFDIPRRVYSRFNKVDSITPETEVMWVHENVGV